MKKTLLTVLLAACFSVNAAEITGTVLHVADGDTITVVNRDGRFRVRLRGIDAPEKAQAYGQEARRQLASVLKGQDVRIVYSERDRYGRVVGTVFRDSEDVCLTMVERGAAWVYRNYLGKLTKSQQTAYKAAEYEAKSAKRGLWQDASAQPPWEWRRAMQRQQSQSATGAPSHPQDVWQSVWKRFLAWIKG